MIFYKYGTMVEDIKKVNLFRKWKNAIVNVKFETQSPHPDLDYYKSPEPLPKCSNSALQLDVEKELDKTQLVQYFKVQTAILKFNNPDFDKDDIVTVFSNRIIHWSGNEALKNFQENYSKIITDTVNEVFGIVDSDVLTPYLEHTTHWYSDEIEKSNSHSKGEPWGVKTRAKQKARATYNAEINRSDIEKASIEYQENNYGVLPSISDLLTATSLTQHSIKKYGQGLFVKPKINTEQRIIEIFKCNSNLPYADIAQISGESLRSVERYLSAYKKSQNHT